jgi:hypothetical protein
MPNRSSLFENRESQPIRVGNQEITLISRALIWRFPFPGALVWNRPVAVRVVTGDASAIILPVVDETRRQQIMLLAIGILGSILLGALLKRR